MIGNVIDRRKKPYVWKNVTAIMEPTWHDNSCTGADKAEQGKGEGVGYQEFADISVSLAMLTAYKMDFMVTVFLYDLGDGISEVPANTWTKKRNK